MSMRHDVIEPARRREVRAAEDAADRARDEVVDRAIRRGVAGDDSAVGLHQEHARGESRRASARPADSRRSRRTSASGTRRRSSCDRGRSLASAGRPRATARRRAPAAPPAAARRARSSCAGLRNENRNEIATAPMLLAAQVLDRGVDVGVVERRSSRPRRRRGNRPPGSRSDGPAAAASTQCEAVEVAAVRVLDEDGVAEAAVRDEGDPRAAPLDERVGGDGRAMNEEVDDCRAGSRPCG